MRKMIITAALSVIVAVGANVGVFAWQNHNITTLTIEQSALITNVRSLEKQYAAAQTAADISTSSWKQYCDQFSPFCLSYPSQWTLTDSPLNLPNDKRDFGTITDPGKTTQINYANPLIKDGGSLSARIIKVDHMTVNGTKLSVMGIIPISSGVYQPTYEVLDGEQALNAKPGADPVLVFGSINPRFTVGKYDSILLNGYPLTKITSYAQAQAWFDSTDGKTALAIIKSLHTH